MYKESAEVIRLVDKFMDDLKIGVLPEVPQLGLDPNLLVEHSPLFLSYFQKLKFEPKMFEMTCLELGLNWEYFQKFLEEDAVKLRGDTSGIAKFLLNSADSQEWLPLIFNYAKAKRLINYFSDLQKDPQYIEKKDKQAQQVTDKINDAFKHFDYLLSIHQKVYILAIDIRFIRFMNLEANNSLEQLIEQVLKDQPEIQNIIFKLIPNRLRTYTKLEHDYQNGLKLSCVFILRRFNINQEDEIAAYLQTALKKKFSHYDSIEVINGNKFVRTDGNEHAVGRVGIKTPNRVEQFKYWVLSYFFKIDLVAKLIHPQITFEVNGIVDDPDLLVPEIHYPAVSSKKTPPPKSLAQILQD